MAEDFSFLTDSEDERAVEDLLSQALDLSTLEQVSAINCSSFSHSPLPSPLESRFRKLKSFPISGSSVPSNNNKSFPRTKSLKPPSNSTNPEESDDSSDDSSIFKPSKMGPLDNKCSKSKPKDGSFRSASNSSKFSDDDSSADSAIFFTASKREMGSKSISVHGSSLKLSDDYPYVKTGSKSISGYGSKSFRSNSSKGMESDDDSPPRSIGCFWCSPKNGSSRKLQRGENRFDWGKDADLLSDLGSFSIKEQERILKKAIKEEEKINREAAKIVKWAKQASARMDVVGLDADELSDNDNDNAN